jgi:hypothetical protein
MQSGQMIQRPDLSADSSTETAHQQACQDLSQRGRGPPRHPGARRGLREIAPIVAMRTGDGTL